MNLSEDQLASLDRYVEAKTVLSIMEKAAKIEEVPLKEEFFLWWTERLYIDKAVPENPRITTSCPNGENNSVLFQIRSTFRPERNLPPPKNRAPNKSIKEYLIERLQTIVDAKRAVKIFRDNLRVEKAFSLKYSASPKLIKKWIGVMFAQSETKMTLSGCFTEEERAELFGDPVEVIIVIGPDKLFHRALSACWDLDEVRGLIKFFSPEIVISNLKFALSARIGDTPELDAARRILGEN